MSYSSSQVWKLKRVLMLGFDKNYRNIINPYTPIAINLMTSITSGIAMDICQTVLTYNKISEKQAYVISSHLLKENVNSVYISIYKKENGKNKK